MLTKETCLQKYAACKRDNNGEIPLFRDFLKFAGISDRDLVRLFGASAYSKLQTAAGDAPNKLQMERTPIDVIMKQYASLVIECGTSPPHSEWSFRGLRPTESGLRSIHNLKWSEMPARFKEWAATKNSGEFDEVLQIIGRFPPGDVKPATNEDRDFARLIRDVREWTAARRRNSEETYKVELRKHLENLNYTLNEEFGESKYDLLVDKKFAIEVKKDPDLGEYDRLFGQLARHLQHQFKVIVLILDATRKDKYDNFTLLVDRYLNVGQNLIEVIKR